MKKLGITVALMVAFFMLNAQSLLDELETQTSQFEYTSATFKANRIIMGQSVENVKTGELNFAVMHNFGPLSGGYYEFFGIDAANTALNFEYGASDKMNVGIGRSTYQRYTQFNGKYKAIAQSSKIPITVSVFGAGYIYGIYWNETQKFYDKKHRYSYLMQVLIARKFNDRLSLQVTPTYMHKNLVKFIADKNDIFAFMAGGRYKITNRVTVNAEYSYVLPNCIASDYQNYLALGVDLETGGHVFQLRLSNATSLYEPNFMTKSQNRWLDGDISFGFTINRRFSLYSN